MSFLSYKRGDSSMLPPFLKFPGSCVIMRGGLCYFSGWIPPPGHLLFCPLLSIHLRKLSPSFGPQSTPYTRLLLKVTDFYWMAEGTASNDRASGTNSKSNTGHDFSSGLFFPQKDLPLQSWGLFSHGNWSLLTVSKSPREHTLPASREAVGKCFNFITQTSLSLSILIFPSECRSRELCISQPETATQSWISSWLWGRRSVDHSVPPL